MRHFRMFVALIAVSALIAPAAAFAQAGPAQDGYDNQGPQIQEQIDQSSPANSSGGGGGGEEGSPPAATAQSNDAGDLPFTGLDLALVIGAGALLLGLGFGMRRLTRPTGEVA